MIFTVSNVFVQRASEQTSNKALRNDLTDSFNIALKRLDTSLVYNSLFNRITTANNTTINTGVIVMNASNNVNFTGNTISQTNVNRPEFNSVIDTAKILEFLEKFAKEQHITDKSVYILLVYKTNGYRYWLDIKKMLNSRGYSIINTVLIPMSKLNIEPNYGISLTIYENKIGVIVPDFYTP